MYIVNKLFLNNFLNVVLFTAYYEIFSIFEMLKIA